MTKKQAFNSEENKRGAVYPVACKWYSLCPLRRFEAMGTLDLSWRNQYCRSDSSWENCKRYQLEEQGIDHPDNMLPDGRIDASILSH